MTNADPIVPIDPSTASDLVGRGAVVLDVREPKEWRFGHIRNLASGMKAGAVRGLPIRTDDGTAGTVG
ncbi:hypothetical protein [Pseudonocardia sp. GCM10023141]|uniref:hypothetical protein n=1 Tax=Pseudonocardia sp. GCM10023141 TaxID=3252653 RepID=UPI00361781B1